MRFFLAVFLAISLLLPLPVFAVDQAELMKKIDDMSRELESLKQQMKEMQKKDVATEEKVTMVEKKAEKSAGPAWLEISGDYRARFDSLKGKVQDYMQYNPMTTTPYQPAPGYPYFLVSPVNGYTAKNETLLLNRFGLNLNAKATEDITVKARLLMYKVWGHETNSPVQGDYFADRAFGPFDGTVAHVPSDNILRVDQAYATWSNIGGAPVWFSVGRRPSTAGLPTNLRQNVERMGNAGIPALMVDYAFDGATIGVAPDIDALPGAYAKICYGRGFDSGYETPMNDSIKDTDFLGVNIVPYETDNIHVELQWQRGFNIFNSPSDGMNQLMDMTGSGNYVTVNTPVQTNMGDIDWYGGVVQGRLEKLGIGNLNLFASAAMSKTHPNKHLFSMPFFSMDGVNFMNAGFGLLYDDDPMTPEVDSESHEGYALYLGARYDITSSKTMIGLEYNHGSKHWIGMVPAADDLWTSKLGTRGDVFEAYIIQELKQKLISKKGKAFFRLGYQYYDFEYTGSNSWVGASKKISDLNTMDPSGTQMMAPLKDAHDIYLTFDVTF